VKNGKAFIRRLQTITAAMTVVLLTGCGTTRTAYEPKPTDPLFPPGMSEDVVASHIKQMRDSRPSLWKRLASCLSSKKPAPELVYRGGDEAESEPPAPRKPAMVSATISSRHSVSVMTNLAVSLWLRCDAYPSAAQEYAGIIGKYDPQRPEVSEWLLGLDHRGRVFMRTTGDGTPLQLVSSSTIARGLWFHICGEWKKDGSVVLHVNGERQTTGTLRAPRAGNLPILIGDVYPSDGSRVFAGSIDEVKMWSRPFGLTDVRELYAQVPDHDKDGIMDGDDADDNNDGIPDEWAFRYFGDRLAGDPRADDDNDGYDNRSEYISGTDPDDATSLFGVDGIGRQVLGGGGNAETFAVLTCNGVRGRTYQAWVAPGPTVERSGWAKAGNAVHCTKDGPTQIFVPEKQAPVPSVFVVTVSMTGSTQN
jgi:hypothetical protein